MHADTFQCVCSLIFSPNAVHKASSNLEGKDYMIIIGLSILIIRFGREKLKKNFAAG
jgi:hypothetical protein